MHYVLILIFWNNAYGGADTKIRMAFKEFNAIAECEFAKTQIVEQFKDSRVVIRGFCAPMGEAK